MIEFLVSYVGNMLQGMEESNFSQILSPFSFIYQAVCSGLSPVWRFQKRLNVNNLLHGSLVTWFARTYLELESSAFFFSRDLVVNSDKQNILETYLSY